MVVVNFKLMDEEFKPEYANPNSPESVEKCAEVKETVSSLSTAFVINTRSPKN